MLIGARNAIMSKNGLSAKSYVQNGLVAMWDGIENAGYGVHDANATVWKDLAGNHDAIFTMGHSGRNPNPNMSWTSDACVFPGGGVSTAEFVANLGGTLTLQFCYSGFEKVSSFWAIYDTYDDTVNFWWRLDTGWNANIYGRSVRLFKASADWLPQTGVVSHGFSSTFVGLQKNDSVWNGNAPSTFTPSSKTWCIGGPYATNYMKGNMHNVRIYNHVLTSDEIAYNYSIDKARFNLP